MHADVEEVKRALMRKETPKDPSIDPADLLSTGSALLNLACSGRVDGGFLKGHYYLFVGDSDSGKTFITMTCLAEASINKAFDKYRLIYDGSEYGALMNIEKFFGPRVASRLEPPRTKKRIPVYSQTVEDFYYNLHDATVDDRPFIYVLDSQDSLTSKRESDKFDLRKRKARGKATASDRKKSEGDYADGKAKAHSSMIRKFLGPLKDKGSILIVINQSRDSFDPFNSKVYSGGRALKFYATLQMWSSKSKTIEKTYRGKSRQLGIRCKVQVLKNRLIGKDRTVTIPIYHSFGIDDVGSCIDYLVSEKVWKKDSNGSIEVTGLGPKQKMKPGKLRSWIIDEELGDDLRVLVAKIWTDVEAACEMCGEGRYS